MAFVFVGLTLAQPTRAQVARPDEFHDVAGNCVDDGENSTCRVVPDVPQMGDDDIVVLASGLLSPRTEAGQTFSILTSDDLARIQGPDLARVMQRLPGVTLVRNGGRGGLTSVAVRGAASERVLVLLDGVRLNDVAAPAGGLDFSDVSASGIERVELLRGSGSLVWGSDALAGVIHLTSRIADGAEASMEAGGDRQVAGTVALGNRGPDHRVGLSAAWSTAGGFSSADSGTEADGFNQLSLSARGELDLTPDWTLFGSARHMRAAAEIDGFPAPAYLLGDTLERQDTRQTSARSGIEYADGRHAAVLSLATSETRRNLLDEAFSPDPFYQTTGRSTRAEARGRLVASDTVALVGGGDWERMRFSDGFTQARTRIASGHAMLEWQPVDGALLTAGGRFDDHADFGGKATLAASANAVLAPDWRIRGSWGQGFKAPSLFQLNSDYGNALLQPERSDSVDAGVEYGGAAGGLQFTVFRNSSRNLIDFVACPANGTGICADRPDGTYANIGRARQQGLEAEGRAQILAGLVTRLAYAFIDSINRQTGNRLARRPRHAGTISLDWQALEPLALGADLRVVSASFDDLANTRRLGGHAVLDLRASRDVTGDVTLYGRIENAWDERYQTALGYAQAGRAAYVGVRARL
ncbi:MAG: TonB-dependent receptor [Pseudomonadota bacterium]